MQQWKIHTYMSNFSSKSNVVVVRLITGLRWTISHPGSMIDLRGPFEVLSFRTPAKGPGAGYKGARSSPRHSCSATAGPPYLIFPRD